MTDAPDIDATELVSVRAEPNGRRLRLKLRDGTGRITTIALPSNWLDAIVRSLPWPPSGNEAHTLASWSIDRTNGEDLLLTLRTAEGQAVSFAMKPWQIAGMATIATYGNADPRPKTMLH